MDEEVILCLDPAISTGYAVVRIDKENNTAEIYKEGIIFLDNSSEYVGDTCLDLVDQIKAFIKEDRITHIVVEDFFFNRRKANGSTVNVMLRTAVYMCARKHEIPYTIININAWKTFIAGRAHPTKEQKAKWGVAVSHKLFIQEALWMKYGFRFPNHCISPKTGKPMVFRSDVCDAVAQAVYACRMIFDVIKVTRTSDVPEDFNFRVPPKNIYTYPTSPNTSPKKTREVTSPKSRVPRFRRDPPKEEGVEVGAAEVAEAAEEAVEGVEEEPSVEEKVTKKKSRSTTKKSTAKKAGAKKSPVKKAGTKKSTSKAVAKKSTSKAASTKKPAKKAGAKKTKVEEKPTKSKSKSKKKSRK